MDSKIVVYGVEFLRALRAALAVATRKEPRDFIQFRVIDETLYVCASTGWDSVMVEVPTEFVDMDDKRDSFFEISRAEATVLSAMKVKVEDKEFQPLLGILVHEFSIQLADESGIGIPVRAVKVRRSQPIYESQLGNIPRAIDEVFANSPTDSAPCMKPQQWKMAGQVASIMQTNFAVWTDSSLEATVIRNIILGDDVKMVMMTSIADAEEKPDEAEVQEPEYVNVPLALEPPRKMIEAVPLGGIS